MQHLQVENEDLKEEIRDNRAFIKQLMTKKKGHAQIIHKMFTENQSLKTQLNKALEVHRDHLLDSDDKISGVEPGIDGTTTQEHRQRFDKDRKMTKLKQPSDFSSDEEDSFYLHHLDDVNDMSLSND
ncbi:uncharacterized protein [Montipora foliosa]|uniref:uncharacterized protein n=1 Tax=Montipora foliosa TaxID=591990 RepID=UPI0035F150A4